MHTENHINTMQLYRLNMHGSKISKTWQYTRCSVGRALVQKFGQHHRCLFSWVSRRPSWWPRDHPAHLFKQKHVVLGVRSFKNPPLICDCRFGGFPKMGVLPNHPCLMGIFSYKPTIFRYPH